MDFFARQEIARRHTKLLEVYFGLAVLGTVLAVYFAALFFVALYSTHYGHVGPRWWDPRLFTIVSAATLGIIAWGTFYKTSQLAAGGAAVADLLGARLVPSNTSDPHERQLLNVVEEMAIASGTSVPQVYILSGERAINAFAAGHSTDDMVICATPACLQTLSRDELQGVIAHEFSHILNGDMRLNFRLMGLVYGIICLTIIGRVLLRARGRRNSLPLFGLALLVIGAIGVFFAKLIKSAVSRQRELLADAAAVQFTRNPGGLAGALKKVGGAGSRLVDPNAEDVSHMFFANGLVESWAGMFSTHPPLPLRIRQLDPTWDGQFTPVQLTPIPPPPLARPPASSLADALSGAALLVAGVGAPTVRHLDYAAALKANLPESLVAAAREPHAAVALVYALLLHQDDAVRQRQLSILQKNPALRDETLRLHAALVALDSRARLPLLTLAMNALRHLKPLEYEDLVQNIQSLTESEGGMDLFEYMLQKNLRRCLAPQFGPLPKPVVQYYVLKPAVPACAVLLSALAYAGQEDPAAAQDAFQQGAQLLRLPAGNFTLLDPAACALPQVDAALEKLNQISPPLKQIVLTACARAVAADGVIQEREAELLRAISDSLDCPIPPFLDI